MGICKQKKSCPISEADNLLSLTKENRYRYRQTPVKTAVRGMQKSIQQKAINS